MLNDAAYDKIILSLYQAAGGLLGWQEALDLVKKALSALAVTLISIDRERGLIEFSYEASDLPPAASLDYVRKYHRTDPRARLADSLQIGEWVNCWEHFDEKYVEANSFYQDFLIPYGGRYTYGAKINEVSSTSTIFGVHRGPGSCTLSSQELVLRDRIATHLRTATDLARSRATLINQSRLGTEILSRMRSPIILVNGWRQILQSNEAAQTLLRLGSAVIARGGSLYCRNQRDDNAFALALRSIIYTPPRDAADKAFLRVRSFGEEESIGIYLYALRPSETLGVFGNQPVAMVILHEPNTRVELDPFVVAAAFDLTPGEARVAVATARGDSIKLIARQHGVSVHTVRAQVRSIFEKTGICRQSELVSKIASLPMAALKLHSNTL